MKATTLFLGRAELRRTVGGRGGVGVIYSARPEGTKWGLASHEVHQALG